MVVESDVENPSVLTEQGSDESELQCFKSETKEERVRRLARERKRKQRNTSVNVNANISARQTKIQTKIIHLSL